MSYLNYKEFGEGEPVIILHGLLGMLDNWKTFAKKLAENYWVIIVDQRNHGKSFKSEKFNYKLLSEDLMLFMDDLHIPKAHLMGHSMGGKTVMQFLVDYPDYADKSIIVDISPTGSIGSHEKIFESLLTAKIADSKDRKEIQEHISSYGMAESTVLFLMKNLSRDKEKGGFKWKADINALQENYKNILAGIGSSDTIDKEILFVGGELSNYISKDDLPVIESIFPEYAYQIIEGAGHWVHADKLHELLQVTNSFLEE